MLQAGVEEFMCQAWGQNVADLVAVGTDLAKIDPRIVVKVPVRGGPSFSHCAQVTIRLGPSVCHL